MLFLIVACQANKSVGLINKATTENSTFTDKKTNSNEETNGPDINVSNSINQSPTTTWNMVIPPQSSLGSTPIIQAPVNTQNTQTPNNPPTPTPTQTPEDVKEYTFELNCSIVNWVCEGDYVYSITTIPNELWIFDSVSMNTIKRISLPAKPAEIQLEDNKILISFPTLNSIKYYDKNSCDLTSSIDLPNEVSSFVIYNGFIYYSEDDQWCKVFRTEISSKNTVEIPLNYDNYYFPKLLINKQDNLLYIIESRSTGSTIFYINLSDLSINSISDNDFSNLSRIAYFDGKYLYAMIYKVDKQNANKIVGEFTAPEKYEDGILFVSDDIVITTSGIFDKNTLQPYMFFNVVFTLGLITNSGNLLLFYANTNTMYVFPA